MKLVKEHISFKRGIEPMDAMGTGDPVEQAKRKYHPMFEKVLVDLCKIFDLDPDNISKSVSTLARSGELVSIEAGIHSSSYAPQYGPNYYAIGYDFKTKLFYIAVSVPQEDEPTEKTICTTFEHAINVLRERVDRSEDTK